MTQTLTEPAQAAFLPKNRPYDVKHYRIFTRIDDTTDRFDNAVEITFEPAATLREIELDSEGLEIKGAFWQEGLAGRENLESDGDSLAFTEDKEAHLLRVQFGRDLTLGEAYRIRIRYSGIAHLHHDGFFKVKDPSHPERPVLYFTHFEAVSARKFFPSNDEPYDKATTEMIVEVDPEYQALSNGRKIYDEVIGGDDGNQWRRVHWLQDKPHSTYLVNLAVGTFDEIRDDSMGIPLAVFMAPGKSEEARFGLEIVKQSMKFLQNFYNTPYPWAGYAMVGVPTFLWGGMENTTLTSMRESAMILEDPTGKLQRLRIAAVVAHELAHQWFGNEVTMKWWDDLWLNEAFASYMESLATADHWKSDFPLLESVTSTWDSYFRQEDGPRSHAIVSKDLPTPEDAFDSTNYTKGEHVLRMLDAYIGREAFRKGLNTYLKTYAKGNATYQDFFGAMEEAAKLKLDGFVSSWLLARGYPIVTVESEWDDEAKKLKVALTQKPNHPEDATVFDVKIPVTFNRRSQPVFAESRTVQLTSAHARLEFDLPAKPEWVTWNPGSTALIKLERRDCDAKEWELQALHDKDAVARLAALFEIARPWIDREVVEFNDLSSDAKETLKSAICKDLSPYVRAFLLDKLADSKWSRLPGDMGKVVLEAAKRPTGFLTHDEIGEVFVRSRALGFLGKLDYKPGHEYIKTVLQDTDAGIDLVSWAAEGMARVGDKDALITLKGALKVQKDRGYPVRKYILIAHAAAPTDAVVPELKAIITGPDANNELLGGFMYRLQDNETLKNSAQGAEFFRYLILDVPSFNDEIKSRVLSAIEDSKNIAVLPALKEIAARSTSPRLRTLTQNIIDKNFPGK